VERELITVVTEAVLEKALTQELEALGASGYTITDARGRGSRGARRSAWRESSNIRIEVLCSAALADKLVTLLREKYYDNFAMVLWRQPVEVLRPEKFS
jgi:nitrogen regulatory protein PII